MYVCLCRAITDRAILEAIEKGARSVGEVVRRCGAGTGCGGCRPAIGALIHEYAWGEARADGATVIPLRASEEEGVDERRRSIR